MKKNSLVPNKGLSLSQAQSISNLCNQRASEIAAQLLVVNNFSKTVKVKSDTKTLVEAHKLPENVVELLTTKSKLHACQAFLMENLKAKESMLKALREAVADVTVDSRRYADLPRTAGCGSRVGKERATSPELDPTSQEQR